MNNFWTNIFRYPRFFISSLFGLVLIILTPLKNIFKNSKLRILLILSIIIFFISLYTVLKKMLGL